MELHIRGRLRIAVQQRNYGRPGQCNMAGQRAQALGSSCTCIPVAGQSPPAGHGCTLPVGN